jgi:hypothetical protein
MGFVEMMNTQKVLAASAILAAAGTTFAQVTPGSFTPDATDNMESYPGGRTVITSLFGGDVSVGGAVTFNSIDQGDWIDFRGGLPVQASSGTRFGAIFGVGQTVEFDFSNIGGITAFSANATAAGIGADSIEFFDLDGNSIGFFSDGDGWGPGDGSMELISYTSDVAIGTVAVTGVETCFDDIAYAQGDLPAQIILLSEEQELDVVAAADNLGLNYDQVVDQAGLEAGLGSGQYRFAIVDITNFGATPTLETAIADFISSGNRAHLTYWNMDASPTLQGAFGIASAVDYSTPRQVFNNASHPSWGGTASPVTLDGTDPWLDNGDSLTAASGAEVVSTFDSASGDGATVVANDNRTLANGFEYDTKSTADIQNLLEAQISWVRTSSPPPPPPGSQVIQFQSDNDSHLAAAVSTAGITPDLVLEDDFPGLTAALNDPTYGVALISNPCCFFDAGTPGALADFIDRGNSVHMSFWDMDGDPTLQSAFGVASAVDFFTPRPIFDNASHPSWGSAASPVNPEAAPTPWNDNGDTMTAASGAAVVGTFDSTSGGGAIIVANGDSTLFNGFDYDSLETAQIRDLLAAQLGWLPTPGGSCYADFDGDGSLTIFDFLAFQNAFDGGDSAADCDEDGALTLFDFLCFQNAFDAGCE